MLMVEIGSQRRSPDQMGLSCGVGSNPTRPDPCSPLLVDGPWLLFLGPCVGGWVWMLGMCSAIARFRHMSKCFFECEYSQFVWSRSWAETRLLDLVLGCQEKWNGCAIIWKGPLALRRSTSYPWHQLSTGFGGRGTTDSSSVNQCLLLFCVPWLRKK